MPKIFSRINKARDARQKKKHGANDFSESLPARPQWDDAYTRSSVDPDEIDELIHYCTLEIKSRGLDHPFLLLPFRPTSDPSAVRTFIRNFFGRDDRLRGEVLMQEVRLAEPMVLASVLKWCWSRLQGGVVSWDAYELFKVGELDSKLARDSFKTFIPISVESDARQHIIFDFFELIASIAAHGKANGLGGVKLSRMAAWWAFEQKDTGEGFSGGYRAWHKAADATTHMFFAYLRSLSPEQKMTGISMLPRSLQKLLSESEYPPKASRMLVSRTNRLVMVVDTVSPTPFALLRRARKFEYRDSDITLRKLTEFEDVTEALTDECRRVLKAISAANQSQASSAKISTSLRDASWSRFEDIGFSSTLSEEDDFEESAVPQKRAAQSFGQSKSMMNVSSSATRDARPTTPSWADFLSTGFVDDSAKKNTLVPPDKVLPPIDIEQRQQSSQSHQPRLESDRDLDPGELASITSFELDEAFWWVWMSSLAPEETNERKAAFGRCAVIETTVYQSPWLVLEEIIAGAAPDPQEGAYIAEKKGFFSWTKRGRTLSRHKSARKHSLKRGYQAPGGGSTSAIGAEAQAKIAAKAAQLRAIKESQNQPSVARRGRTDDEVLRDKTTSIFSLQPHIAGEASSALKWVKKYDNGAIKDTYMHDTTAGRGLPVSPAPSEQPSGHAESMVSPLSLNKYSLPSPAPTNEKPMTPMRKVAEADEPQADEMSAFKPADIEIPDNAILGHRRSPPKPESVPTPPPKDEEFAGAPTPASPSPSPAPAAVSKAVGKQQTNKEPKEKGGFLKLFRKNRSSKVPDNSAAQLNSMLQQDAAAAASEAGAAPVDMDTTGAKSPAPIEQETTDSAAKATAPEPTLEVDNLQSSYQEPAGDIGKSPVASGSPDSRGELSRFDQGPLTEQPAFVPQDEVDEAAPPPITRHMQETDLKGITDLTRSASPGVQDRWAQIRKNAASRAAQRQGGERERTLAAGKNIEADDNTNGEETIESRVARIKARVAELTGNMEGTHAPPMKQPNGVPSN